MKKPFTGILLAVLTTASIGLSVAESGTNSAIETALKRVLPGSAVSQIQPSPVKGMSEVLIGSKLFYVTDDGKYLIQGSIIDLNTRTDISEERRKGVRLDVIDGISEDNMIIFPAENEKHKVTVFTDIDCGYCRKLHNEVAQINKKGITVRYLMYPRSGVNTPSYDKAVSVWCSADRNVALTRSKQGDAVPDKKCSNPVKDHMDLGSLLGVRGTPAIVLDDGEMVPGYLPANKLAQALNSAK